MLTVHPFAYPTPLPSGNPGNLIQNRAINNTGHKVAFIIQAPEDGTITEVYWRTSTVTNPQVDVRIETVNTTTGEPTGTLWGTNTNGSYSASSTASVQWRSATLTAGAVVNKGDLFAVVIAWVSGSMGVQGSSGGALLPYTTPYLAQYTASWARPGDVPIVILNDSGTYRVPLGAACGIVSGGVSINLNSTPDEIGNLYTPLFTQQVCGITAVVDFDGDMELVVYNAADTVLATIPLYPGVRQANTGGGGIWSLADDITLTKGQQYRLVIKPTTTTNVIVYAWDVPSAAGVAVAPGGSEFVYTSRVNGGPWTETTTRQAMVLPVINGIQAGGLLVHGGMAGGMRG